VKRQAVVDDRARFSRDEWRLLCDCVVTVCVDVTGERGDQGFWPAADAILAKLGEAALARSAETRLDLTQLVLAEFASPTLRNDVLARAEEAYKSCGLARTDYSGAAKSEALELVDKRCPDQAFPFRAAMILIAMAIEDELVT
jgi:hypothetical protein